MIRALALVALLATPAVAEDATDAGRDVYLEHCAACHGQNLDDGEFAPSLHSQRFAAKWRKRAALLAYVTAAMPPGQAGSLSQEDYAATVDHILRANGATAGQSEKR